jgi:hypothetical protein
LIRQGTRLTKKKCRKALAPARIRKEVSEIMSVTILPTFKGYTVDLRLREFRRAIPHVTLDFIPFTSPEGEKLLEELKSFARDVLAPDTYR